MITFRVCKTTKLVTFAGQLYGLGPQLKYINQLEVRRVV